MAKRQVIFVCAGLLDQTLVAKSIPAQSAKEAGAIFFEQTKSVASEVFGPFYKKRSVYQIEQSMKFSDQMIKAEYDGWKVNACLLNEPKGQAFLIFMGRLDGKKMMAPKSMMVSISDLRFED